MDGWTLRDNTGLKGEVAQWAKNNLEPERFKDSPVSACVTPIAYDMVHESETFEEHLTGCDYIVQAIGYRRDPLPRLKRGVGTIEVDYDRLTGAFLDMGQNGEKIPGLYGAGIAFPEKVTDPHGNVEYAVGMWKFMRYMKRVSCDWN
ncbi:hypothetical protein ANO11243_073170 [Dothideomycetidae sp. 11243]|nr:hypothetical protein ANO11243_073170 [fungal sp. No.11243]